MNESLIKKIEEIGIVPVISLEDVGIAECLGKTLLEAGLPCIEITYRTTEATESIKILSKMSGSLIIGAGTVLTIENAHMAVNAGADFIVSPGFDPKLVDWCLERGIAVIPGVATPSEIIQAMNKGLWILKIFPAEQLGGVNYLKALSSVFKQIKFVPTGGVNASNLVAYLELPGVIACGGSWIGERKLLSNNAWEEIKLRASQAVEIVKNTRQREKFQWIIE